MVRIRAEDKDRFLKVYIQGGCSSTLFSETKVYKFEGMKFSINGISLSVGSLLLEDTND